MAAPAMPYFPNCASPLDPAERAKAAAEEVQTGQEISELRRLLEKRLSPPASGGETGFSQSRTS